MMPHGIDTSPKIAEYGKYWNRTFGSTTNSNNWCISEWYDVIDAPKGSVQIGGYVGADTTSITFQYWLGKGDNDWYYFAGVNPRNIPIGTDNRIVSITFSIQVAEIDNSYAYIVNTGQIIFAGTNTPYYGHRNISELN